LFPLIEILNKKRLQIIYIQIIQL